jgi:hypothetical protein
MKNIGVHQRSSAAIIFFLSPDSQVVDPLQRRATTPADDGGAIAAYERVLDGGVALGAI